MITSQSKPISSASDSVMVVCVLVLSLVVLAVSGCNRRHVSDLVVTHFDTRTPLRCQASGQYCKYDRNCCAGLECKMDFQGMTLASTCQYRKVYDNYVEIMDGPSWKDYQENKFSEEEKSKRANLEDLEAKNNKLRRKLFELNMLRKVLRRQQLMDTKRNMEQQEIETLREEQLWYKDKVDEEVDRLRKQEYHNQLLSLERKEVNHTLSAQKPIADLYLDIQDMVNRAN